MINVLSGERPVRGQKISSLVRAGFASSSQRHTQGGISSPARSHSDPLRQKGISRMHSMKRLFVPLFCSAALFCGAELPATTLLQARPAAPCIEVRQWQGASGFILWTPTFTLAQAIEMAGGLQSRNDRIEIQHLASNSDPDLLFNKNQLLQNPKIQKQTFSPGDRVTITRLLKPF